MTVRTERICPPIPTRQYDWSAWVDGEEEQCSTAYGPTEAEALRNLAEQLAEKAFSKETA
jgi:hypothetical protein